MDALSSKTDWNRLLIDIGVLSKEVQDQVMHFSV